MTWVSLVTSVDRERTMIDIGDAILRPLEPKDVDSLYPMRNDWEVVRFLGGFSAGFSRANLEDWLTMHTNRPDEVLWAIAGKTTDALIGHVGLYAIDNRVRKAEFGIFIGDHRLWGRGLGTRAATTVVAWGFEQLNLHKIVLEVLTENERAIHIYSRLGFQRDGVLRHEQYRDGRYMDIAIMSLLEDEWHALKSG